MDFLSLAQNRYTTKIYNGKTLSKETLEQLNEILRLAPSSINSQPWEFILVGDKRKDEVFAPLSLMNEERVKQASHIVIFRVLESVEHFEEEAPFLYLGRRADFLSTIYQTSGRSACQGLDGTTSICSLRVFPCRMCCHGSGLNPYGRNLT